MKVLCFFVFIQTLMGAAQVDTAPLLIPVEYKPLIDIFKDVVEVDEAGTCKKTLRQVKEIMDPLKERFDELTTIENLIPLVKDFEEPVKRYYADYVFRDHDEELTDEQIEAARDDVIESYDKIHTGNIEGFLTFFKRAAEKLKLSHQSEHQKNLDAFSFATSSLNDFYRHLKLKDVDFGWFSLANSDISCVLEFPKEKLDVYCPIELQKIFFPFYMVGTIRAVFKTCDLILDDEKEGMISLSGAPLSITDVTDKLDQPFFEAFDIMLKQTALELSKCSRKRLLENIFFMLNNHVSFEKDETNCL